MRRVCLLAGLLLSNIYLASAQDVQQLPKNDPQMSAGRLVAKGENTHPVGDNKLLSYKLEEVDLPKPMEFDIRGKKLQLSTVLRLTITSESISGAHTIWIDCRESLAWALMRSESLLMIGRYLGMALR